LLRTINEGANAPRVLVLATIRPASELDGDTAAELTLLRTRMDVETLSLGGLSQASCEKLSRTLLNGAVEPEWLSRIATESKGHPLFVSVLSRYVSSHSVTVGRELSLEGALSERISRLDPSARKLLEMLALAVVPCTVALMTRALGTAAERVQKHAAELVSAKLLRRLPHQHLACFHDRVRSAALARLNEADRVALHAALAQAVAQEPAHDLGVLAGHLEGAGQLEFALATHQRAGARALADLAFGKAQHHYARAIALATSSAAATSLLSELRSQRGHALARGGKSALAAQSYLDACEHASQAQRVELRVWAAQHLLQSAQVAAGLAAAREVLAELGVPLPNTARAALARVVWDRACLRLRGHALSESKAEVSVEERARLDAMWNLVMPISWIDVLPGATLGTRHLRRSLSAGDRTHAARALAQEARFATMQKPDAPERPIQLFERARQLYDADHSPALEAFALYNQGSAAIFRFESATARDKLTAAEALLRARCPEEPWLLTNVRHALSSAWWTNGELGARLAELERWVTEAEERDDRFAVSSIETLGFYSMRFLLRDEPAQLRQRVAQVMTAWPREPFAFAHLGELVVLWHEAMYRGGDAAWQYLENEQVRHARAFLLNASFGKALLAMLRGLAALSAYVAAPQGALAAKYLSAARTQAATLRRSNVPFAKLNAPLIEAQLAAIDGAVEPALARLQVVAAEAKRLGAGFWGPALGYLEGLLQGGAEGVRKRDQALALAAAQGWKNPRQRIAMGGPVIDLLE
jgi:hypothetical protein